MNTYQNLFAEFAPNTKAEWQKQVLKELKNESFEEKTQWNIAHDLKIDALYVPQDIAHLQYLQQQLIGIDEQTKTRNWNNAQIIKVIDENQANEQALRALNNGVEEIIFELSSQSVNLETLLKEILLPYCHISFILLPQNQDFIKKYIAYIQSKNYDIHTIKGSVSSVNFDKNAVLEWTKQSLSLPNLATIVIQNQATDHVENGVQLLKTTVECIEILLTEGIDFEKIIKKIYLQKSISNLFFVEIANFRALRILFAEVINAYKITDYTPSQVWISAKTSLPNNTQDNNLILLSNTTQAMSAILGGCNTLITNVHEENNLGTRIARNVSNILKEESHFDKVADVSAGSYYIETLTDKIAEAIWTKFAQ